MPQLQTASVQRVCARMRCRRRFAFAPLVSAACLTLVACTANDRLERDVTAAVEQWQRTRIAADAAQSVSRAPPRHDAEAGVPREAAPAAPEQRSTDGELAQHIHAALERNPEIKAAVEEVRIKLARVDIATALPDPILRAITRPEAIQTAAGDVYFTLGVGQKIPFPAKLARAGDIAAAEVRIAIERLNTVRIRLIADVERAYWRVYLLDRYVEITTANRRLLEDLARVIDTRYQVGQVQQQDVLRVQNELAELRNEEHVLQLRRDAAAAALNQMMDRPPAREIAQTHSAGTQSGTGDVDHLITLAAETNPELAALHQQLERDRQQIALADLGYWPDVTLGFEWNYVRGRNAWVPPLNPQTFQRPDYNRASENGDDNWAITAQINLPIWTRRIEAQRRAARHKLHQTQATLHATTSRVAFRIFDAYTRVTAQQDTLDLLRSTLIPQARQAYEVTVTSYQAGNERFLTLIENWRRWLDFERMLHRETVDLHIAHAELQREVGAQLIFASGGQTADLSIETGPAPAETNHD